MQLLDILRERYQLDGAPAKAARDDGSGL